MDPSLARERRTRTVDLPSRPYEELIAYCERCLELYGDNYRGVGWTLSEEATERRYRVMAELMDRGARGASVLDVGCGAAHFYEYLQRHRDGALRYSGLDLSPRFLALSREKHPRLDFFDTDLLDGPGELPRFDYAVMNGLFTFKGDLAFEVMFEYCRRMLESCFEIVDRGLAFNLQSPLAEPREYLFHVPFQRVADLLPAGSTDFVIRHDYGLLDYTVYVYR